jgi:hypothetical protein
MKRAVLYLRVSNNFQILVLIVGTLNGIGAMGGGVEWSCS